MFSQAWEQGRGFDGRDTAKCHCSSMVASRMSSSAQRKTRALCPLSLRQQDIRARYDVMEKGKVDFKISLFCDIV